MGLGSPYGPFAIEIAGMDGNTNVTYRRYRRKSGHKPRRAYELFSVRGRAIERLHSKQNTEMTA
jgi:hypothetical protein